MLVPVKLDFGKCSSVTFNGLRHPTLATVKLHGSLYLESGWICSISRDANQNHPLFVCGSAIVDYLATSKRRVTVKNLLRGGRGVCYAPMVHRGIRDDAYCRIRNPLPEDDVFVVLMGLDFLFRVNVKNLKSPIGCCRF